MIIGITGQKLSGKSTLAQLLVERERFFHLPLAQPIKNMLGTLLSNRGASRDEIREMLYGDKKETPARHLSGETPRHAMQTLGTEWGRQCISAYLWLDAWIDMINMLPARTSVVCDDVRFENEAETIRQMGGRIIRILREFQVRDAPKDTHVSETEMQRIAVDYTITNYENAPEAMLVSAREMIDFYRKTKATP